MHPPHLTLESEKTNVSGGELLTPPSLHSGGSVTGKSGGCIHSLNAIDTFSLISHIPLYNQAIKGNKDSYLKNKSQLTEVNLEVGKCLNVQLKKNGRCAQKASMCLDEKNESKWPMNKLSQIHKSASKRRK